MKGTIPMNYVYFDAFSGASGDMILGALLDLGASRSGFLKKMTDLRLPIKVEIREVQRAGLRGLKVDVRVNKGKESRPRRWRDIETLIKKSPFSPRVKSSSLAAFKTLFQAEAKVHGSPFDKVHLHEAGADDAIIDVMGSSYLAETLGVGRVYCSPLNVGSGTVRTSHGLLPVPPPAVAEILRGAPVYSAWVEEELVTPTGAAILATWAEKFVPFPEMSYQKIGCGAGSRDPAGLPNILRAFYGEISGFGAEQTVFQVEANIDDSSPQLLADFAQRALRLGALDAFLTPVVMKKGRLGTKLTMLAEADRMDGLCEAVFQETSSIGLRYFPVSRRVLTRDIKTIRVSGEDIRIKVAASGSGAVNAQPEFDDCQRVARKKSLPVKVVHRLALQEYFKKEAEKSDNGD
jgi:uncharacterized protein (TIGR00299 family) protein